MKYLRNTLLFLVPVFFLAGCAHDTDFFDGPSLEDQFGEFRSVTPLAASKATVDFAAGETAFFTAEFNKNVDWVLEIKGQQSGALKRIEGFGRVLDMNTAAWNGTTTQLPTFSREENCQVTLSIPDIDTFEQTSSIRVLSGKAYAGNLVTDFETDPLDHIELGNFEFEFANTTGISDVLPAAHGNKYYWFEGTDNIVPNFFVGLIVIKPSIVGETYFPLPTTIPDQLHFNAFLYHDARPHTIAVIQFATDSNNNGAYDDGTDQTFQVDGDYPLAWQGWRQISHTMSEIGMTQEQLEKLVAIRVLLISNRNTQPNPPLSVAFGIDHLIFTQGAPLQP